VLRSEDAGDPPIDRRLAQLAARQHGVVSIDGLRALGVTAQMVKTRVRAGRLHRVHPGIYAVGHARLTLDGRRLAAVLACGDGALLSHRDAGRLHGILRGAGSGHIHVSAPRHRRVTGVRCHVLSHPHTLDGTVIDGIPVTSLERTALDLAVELAPARLVGALEESQRLGSFDLGAFEALLVNSPGHHGLGALRAALAQLSDHPPLVRSGNERRLLEIVREGDLPLPTTNVVVAGETVDAVWPAQRLILEIDSWYGHGQRRAFEDDRRRDAVLIRAGYRVIRITETQLWGDPGAIVGLLRDLLTA
jgi:very-short-patch-repair endonuclease